MLFPKLTPGFALSFILLIIATVLSLSTFVDLNSYAESHDNNNKNISFLSSLSTSRVSDGEELKKSRDVDVNTSSSSASSSSSDSSSSDSSNETSDNKPQLGTLVVMKQVINKGGGDKKPSDFTITVSGNNPTPSSFTGSSSGTTVTVNEGAYNVKEEEGLYISPDYVPGRYTPSYSSECAGTIQAGETLSCTISNKYNPFIPGILSKLIVTKKVVNEGGGDKKPSDFTITVSGNNPTPSSFAGSSSGTTVTLNPGRYSVTENLLSGYTSSMIGDCSGTIDNTGETNECTITNVYQPEDKSAQLIVITNVIDNNNDDSDPIRKPSAFTITVSGNNPTPRSFPGKSGLGVIVNLDPGRYSIT